ncbi:hypothetical protein Scep_029324 [Stephania cephalantha]|uniref:Leucine-rich repeat-containing N-terminal plant-type domain-containing protein n=1 Tax=Stephania cephalantha TaxID=152367 RepID=A0AAP0E556_9MAGN
MKNSMQGMRGGESPQARTITVPLAPCPPRREQKTRIPCPTGAGHRREWGFSTPLATLVGRRRSRTTVQVKVSSSQETEAEALIKWKNSLTSPSPSLNNSWSLDNISNLCNWTGIQCNGGGTVSEIISLTWILLMIISLEGLNLSMDLSKLVGLRELRLGRNRFTGVMPSDIGLIPNLVTLELYNNSFHGQIPSSLGRFIA